MKNGVIKDIGPDSKAQVTVEYEGDKPKRIKTIVVSVQHSANKDLDVLRNEVISQVLWPSLKNIHLTMKQRFSLIKWTIC